MAAIFVIRQLIKYLKERDGSLVITKHCVIMDTVLAEDKIVNKRQCQ